jgi:hypothetical protein
MSLETVNINKFERKEGAGSSSFSRLRLRLNIKLEEENLSGNLGV